MNKNQGLSGCSRKHSVRTYIQWFNIHENDPLHIRRKTAHDTISLFMTDASCRHCDTNRSILLLRLWRPTLRLLLRHGNLRHGAHHGSSSSKHQVPPVWAPLLLSIILNRCFCHPLRLGDHDTLAWCHGWRLVHSHHGAAKEGCCHCDGCHFQNLVLPESVCLVVFLQLKMLRADGRNFGSIHLPYHNDENSSQLIDNMCTFLSLGRSCGCQWLSLGSKEEYARKSRCIVDLWSTFTSWKDSRGNWELHWKWRILPASTSMISLSISSCKIE